jgi:hypothetical protein
VTITRTLCFSSTDSKGTISSSPGGKLIKVGYKLRQGCGGLYFEVDTSSAMEEGAEDISFKLSVSLSLDQREDVEAMEGNIHGNIATSACYASCGILRSASQYLIEGVIGYKGNNGKRMGGGDGSLQGPLLVLLSSC